MSTLSILWVCLVAIVCFDLARLAVSLLRKRAVAHKGLLKMAGALRVWGLKTTPDVLESIATGDWIQANEDIKFWVRLLEGDPNAAIKELDNVFANVLNSHLATPNGLAAVKAAVDAASKV